MIINHNISAIFAHRTLKFHDMEMSKDIEKLSSGMRINRAGDDAARITSYNVCYTKLLRSSKPGVYNSITNLK